MKMLTTKSLKKSPKKPSLTKEKTVKKKKNHLILFFMWLLDSLASRGHSELYFREDVGVSKEEDGPLLRSSFLNPPCCLYKCQKNQVDKFINFICLINLNSEVYQF